MSESTPPPYANYPRNVATSGSSAQLQALMEAYYNYSWLFVLNIALSCFLGFGIGYASGGSPVSYIVYPVLMIIFGFVTHPLNRKLGFGANWSSSRVLTTSILMGLNGACCGIVGYAVLQTIAINHIKKFGVRSGFLGPKKKEIRAKIEELQTLEASGQPRY